MLKDSYIDKLIDRMVTERDAKKKAEHKPSHRLSASALGDPVQWQILRAIGVPPREIDTYTLRKFWRGDQVEEWLVEDILKPRETQKMVEYMGVVGLVDAIVDTEEWDFQVGVIPLEVKSVSNAKYRNILRSGQADLHHLKQACLYGLALGSNYFGIVYVATDDFRTTTLVFETTYASSDVHDSVYEFYKQVTTGVVPAFEPKQAWQDDPKYNRYPDFTGLTPDGVAEKLQVEHSEAYKRLIDWRNNQDAKEFIRRLSGRGFDDSPKSQQN